MSIASVLPQTIEPVLDPVFAAISFPDLAPIDWIGLAVIGIPIVLGVWRGLWWQVIRFVGILAAVALARAFSLPVAELFAERWGDEVPARVLFGASWLLVFLLSLGAATVLGLLGQRLLDAMQLGLANRVGGGVVGAVTGLVIHIAILAVVVQLSTAAFVGRAVHGTYSERLVEAVGIAFPGVFSVEAAEEVRSVLQSPSPSPSDEGKPEPAKESRDGSRVR
ncbi:MAG: membrane protein required for colicin V production [Planctomycetota bacterium]|jgi:membrane protein required for colicin V production